MRSVPSGWSEIKYVPRLCGIWDLFTLQLLVALLFLGVVLNPVLWRPIFLSLANIQSKPQGTFVQFLEIFLRIITSSLVLCPAKSNHPVPSILISVTSTQQNHCVLLGFIFPVLVCPKASIICLPLLKSQSVAYCTVSEKSCFLFCTVLYFTQFSSCFSRRARFSLPPFFPSKDSLCHNTFKEMKTNWFISVYFFSP